MLICNLALEPLIHSKMFHAPLLKIKATEHLLSGKVSAMLLKLLLPLLHGILVLEKLIILEVSLWIIKILIMA